MAVFFMRGSYVITIIFVAFACLSDIADGYIARKYGQKTRLGSFLDPATDKVLLATGNILLVIKGVLPLWYFFTVISRDIFQLAATLILHIKKVKWEPNPNVFGRVAAGLQGTVIFLGIFHLAFLSIKPVITAAIFACVAFTVLSLVAYFIDFSKLIKGQKEV
jgi:cardiolipin synthase